MMHVLGLLIVICVMCIWYSKVRSGYNFLEMSSTCRYTPSQQGVAFNSGAKQRVIRMVEMQKDPMEPPRFKYVNDSSASFQ